MPGGLDWYDVLGVAPEATADEVRAAYRLHARALHPDSRDPSLPAVDADAALRLLNDAWDVIGDPTRRAAYDERHFDSDSEGERLQHGHHGPTRFPWWIVALTVLFVIFVFTAYAGGRP